MRLATCQTTNKEVAQSEFKRASPLKPILASIVPEKDGIEFDEATNAHICWEGRLRLRRPCAQREMLPRTKWINKMKMKASVS